MYQPALQEGACQDFKFMDKISKLLLFETSSQEGGKVRGGASVVVWGVRGLGDTYIYTHVYLYIYNCMFTFCISDPV